MSAAGRTLRLPNVCPGLRVAWVLTLSPRMAPYPPLAPAHATKIPPTTTCSSTPSAHPQSPHPSSPPQAAPLSTGHPTTTGPPPPPTTATTTTAPCHVGSPSPVRPAPVGAQYLDQSAMPSCPRLRHSRRPTASLWCSCRLPLPHHRCPPPQLQPPISHAWEECPSWFLHRTRPALWSNSCSAGETMLLTEVVGSFHS